MCRVKLEGKGHYWNKGPWEEAVVQHGLNSGGNALVPELPGIKNTAVILKSKLKTKTHEHFEIIMSAPQMKSSDSLRTQNYAIK